MRIRDVSTCPKRDTCTQQTCRCYITAWEKCEGDLPDDPCERPTRYDADSVPLCQRCFDAMMAAPDDEEARDDG